MKSRIPYTHVAPGGLKALSGLEEYLKQSELPQLLLHLVKLRASLINGCAYCIDMHWKDLRALGETEQRLYGLQTWEESPWYTEKERAAFAWTDALTNIAQTHANDEVFAKVRPQFNDKELADLSLAIAAINAWNRMAIGFRSEPGAYRSPLKPASNPVQTVSV